MNISIASIAIYVAIILAAVIVYTYLREGDRQGAVMFGAIFTVVLALVAMSLATKHQDVLLGSSDPTPVSEVATTGGEPLANSGAGVASPFDPPEDLTVKDPKRTGVAPMGESLDPKGPALKPSAPLANPSGPTRNSVDESKANPKDPSEGIAVGENIGGQTPGPDTNSGVGTIIRIRPAPSGGEPNPAEPDPD